MLFAKAALSLDIASESSSYFRYHDGSNSQKWNQTPQQQGSWPSNNTTGGRNQNKAGGTQNKGGKGGMNNGTVPNNALNNGSGNTDNVSNAAGSSNMNGGSGGQSTLTGPATSSTSSHSNAKGGSNSNNGAWNNNSTYGTNNSGTTGVPNSQGGNQNQYGAGNQNQYGGGNQNQYGNQYNNGGQQYNGNNPNRTDSFSRSGYQTPNNNRETNWTPKVGKSNQLSATNSTNSSTTNSSSALNKPPPPPIMTPTNNNRQASGSQNPLGSGTNPMGNQNSNSWKGVSPQGSTAGNMNNTNPNNMGGKNSNNGNASNMGGVMNNGKGVSPGGKNAGKMNRNNNYNNQYNNQSGPGGGQSSWQSGNSTQGGGQGSATNYNQLSSGGHWNQMNQNSSNYGGATSSTSKGNNSTGNKGGYNPGGKNKNPGDTSQTGNQLGNNNLFAGAGQSNLNNLFQERSAHFLQQGQPPDILLSTNNLQNGQLAPSALNALLQNLGGGNGAGLNGMMGGGNNPLTVGNTDAGSQNMMQLLQQMQQQNTGKGQAQQPGSAGGAITPVGGQAGAQTLQLANFLDTASSNANLQGENKEQHLMLQQLLLSVQNNGQSATANNGTASAASGGDQVVLQGLKGENSRLQAQHEVLLQAQASLLQKMQANAALLTATDEHGNPIPNSSGQNSSGARGPTPPGTSTNAAADVANAGSTGISGSGAPSDNLAMNAFLQQQELIKDLKMKAQANNPENVNSSDTNSNLMNDTAGSLLTGPAGALPSSMNVTPTNPGTAGPTSIDTSQLQQLDTTAAQLLFLPSGGQDSSTNNNLISGSGQATGSASNMGVNNSIGSGAPGSLSNLGLGTGGAGTNNMGSNQKLPLSQSTVALLQLMEACGKHDAKGAISAVIMDFQSSVMQPGLADFIQFIQNNHGVVHQALQTGDAGPLQQLIKFKLEQINNQALNSGGNQPNLMQASNANNNLMFSQNQMMNNAFVQQMLAANSGGPSSGTNPVSESDPNNAANTNMLLQMLMGAAQNGNTNPALQQQLLLQLTNNVGGGGLNPNQLGAQMIPTPGGGNPEQNLLELLQQRNNGAPAGNNHGNNLSGPGNAGNSNDTNSISNLDNSFLNHGAAQILSGLPMPSSGGNAMALGGHALLTGVSTNPALAGLINNGSGPGQQGAIGSHTPGVQQHPVSQVDPHVAEYQSQIPLTIPCNDPKLQGIQPNQEPNNMYNLTQFLHLQAPYEHWHEQWIELWYSDD